MYPCRGYLSHLGTEQGAATATWEAGSQQQWSMAGPGPLGGNHAGGSCQIGFSDDNGTTFRVAKSYQGDCPHRNGGVNPENQTFDFTVPVDLQTGVQVFAWIWYNREQEFNMNCAAVNILPPGSGSASTNVAIRSSSTGEAHNRDHIRRPRFKSTQARATAAGPPFSERPLMLVADVGNNCLTPRTTAELMFPHPGPDVHDGDGEYPLQLPSGECGQEAMANVYVRQAYKGWTGEDGH